MPEVTQVVQQWRAVKWPTSLYQTKFLKTSSDEANHRMPLSQLLPAEFKPPGSWVPAFLSRQAEMQIACSGTSKPITDNSCQSTVPKAWSYKHSKNPLHLHETLSSLRGTGRETKKGETERRRKRWGEKRRAGKKGEIEWSKQSTREDILKSYRKAGRLGSVSGKEQERTLTAELAVSDGNHSPLPCEICMRSHHPYPRSSLPATCTAAFCSPPGCYAPPSCRSAQDPEKTLARKASAPGAHGNETHLPHAARTLSAIPALAWKIRATL